MTRIGLFAEPCPDTCEDGWYKWMQGTQPYTAPCDTCHGEGYVIDHDTVVVLEDDE